MGRDNLNPMTDMPRKSEGIPWQILIALVIVIVTVAVYWRVGGNGFIAFDDDMYILNNAKVRAGLTLEGIRWAFSSVSMANWHPLTWISHMADVQMFGLNPRGHHLVSLLLHVANGLLLFRLLLAMTGGLWQSAFVALLFAVHPLHVESVAWAAERKDVLSTLFFLLTLSSYHRYVVSPGAGRMAVALSMFILGLMAKPMLVSLPLLLLLLDYWPLGRFASASEHGLALGAGLDRNRVSMLIREKFPFLGIAFCSCIITFLAQKHGDAVLSLAKAPFPYRIANAVTAYATYILKTFWPTKLAILYPLPDSISFWAMAWSVLLLGGISAAVYRYGRQLPFLPVGLLWFLVTLVPVIGLVQVGVQSHADRYTYIPQIGLFIIIAWGGAEFIKRFRGLATVLTVAGITAIIALSVLTWSQLVYWKNSEELFTHTLGVTSDNVKIETLLGNVLSDVGRDDEAISHYREALRILPTFDVAHVRLAVVLVKRGQIDEAIYHNLEALKSRPDYGTAHNNLGMALALKGNLQEAEVHFGEAVRLAPDNVDFRINLGMVLSDLGKRAEALRVYREAQGMDPANREIAGKIILLEGGMKGATGGR
jgi:Flp pilus assembly protein TadD